jgi:hypothetical protein
VPVEHCQQFLIVSVSCANSADMCVVVSALFVSGSRVVVFGHWAAAAAALPAVHVSSVAASARPVLLAARQAKRALCAAL